MSSPRRSPKTIKGSTPGAAHLAAAPISWGVCEVPGWGMQLPPERVFAEMSELGISATELGPQGWLPEDGSQARAVLDRYDLQLVGGFVPVVVHGPDLGATLERARSAAAGLADAGADVFVAAAVEDLEWSTPTALDADGWKRAGERLRTVAEIVASAGLELVLHPHVGTILETSADVDRALEHTDVAWCFDTGHLLIGGVDPLDFARAHADRVGHVHLKDVDLAVAERLRRGELTLMAAVRQGLFQPLGDGDAQIAQILSTLGAASYDGWLVLEQDLAITDAAPTLGDPVANVRRSIAFLSAQPTVRS